MKSKASIKANVIIFTVSYELQNKPYDENKGVVNYEVIR